MTEEHGYLELYSAIQLRLPRAQIRRHYLINGHYADVLITGTVEQLEPLSEKPVLIELKSKLNIRSIGEAYGQLEYYAEGLLRNEGLEADKVLCVHCRMPEKGSAAWGLLSHLRMKLWTVGSYLVLYEYDFAKMRGAAFYRSTPNVSWSQVGYKREWGMGEA